MVIQGMLCWRDYSAFVDGRLRGTSGSAERARCPAGDPAIRTAPIGDKAQRYVVTFKPHVGDPAALTRALARGHRAKPRHVFTLALRGYSAAMSSAEVEALRRHPDVASVEAVQQFVSAGHSVQSAAPWGLDRIDQDALPLDTKYKYTRTASGRPVVNILDTGYSSDLLPGVSIFSGGDLRPEDGQNGVDCSGHGSAVAGLIAHPTWGVAKNATIRSVRILGCDGRGSTDDLIAGINNVIAYNTSPLNGQILVIAGTVQTSTGIETTNSGVDNAVVNAYNDGLTVVVAAGDQNKNACNVSPARVGVAITVSSSNSADARAPNANTGSCVDIFAPGFSVRSVGGTGSFTGSSFAVPHVAGVAVLRSSIGFSPAQNWTTLLGLSNTGRLTGVGSGSPNRLLHSEGVLKATVLGPSSVSTATPHTWTTNPTGGVGHYTYRWTVRKLNGQVISVGTSQSVTITPAANWGIFYVNVYVRSDGSPELNAFRAVNNQIPGGCTLC